MDQLASLEPTGANHPVDTGKSHLIYPGMMESQIRVEGETLVESKSTLTKNLRKVPHRKTKYGVQYLCL